MHAPRPSSILARSVASLLVVSTSSFAVDWVGGVSGDFNDPANWNANPAGQNVYIGIVGNPTGPAPFTATLNADLAFPIVDLQVARGGGPALFNHNAGSAVTGNGNWVDVGTLGGTGTYNLANSAGTGGTLTGLGLGSGSLTAGGTSTDGRLYIGGVEFGAAGGNGTFNMNTSGTVTVRNDLVMGSNGGTGLMNVDAGTMTTGGWNFIGKDSVSAGGSGTLRMSGGSLTNLGAATFVGLGNSTGTIELSGTAVYNNTRTGDGNTHFVVGAKNLANPTTPVVNLSGGTLNAERRFMVGGNEPFGTNGSPDFSGPGKGIVNVTGSSALLNVTGEMWVGNQAGSIAEMNVSAGTVQTNNWIAVGRNGADGTLNLSGTGTINKSGGGSSTIGTGTGGVGRIVQTGGAFNSATNDVIIGENGTGQGFWTMNGGTASVAALNIAQNDSAQGTVTVGGTAVLTADRVRTGWGAAGDTVNTDGKFIINTGGTVNVVGGGDVFQIGDQRGVGRLTLDGGNLNLTNAGGNMVMGWAGTASGTVDHNSGSLNILGSLSMNGGNNGATIETNTGTQTYNMAGGTLSVNEVFMARGGGGVALFNQTGGNIHVLSTLDLQGGGTGTFTLSGGVLGIDGSLDNSAGTFAFSGGKLTRTIPGVLSILGGLSTLENDATLKLDADKTFAIAGAFDKTLGLTLELTGIVIPAWDGDGIDTGTLTLGSVGSIVGTFGPATDVVTGLSNLAGATFISETLAEGGFDPLSQSAYWVRESGGVVTLEYNVVPEPTSASLLGLAGLALLARRRRAAR